MSGRKLLLEVVIDNNVDDDSNAVNDNFIL
jgi:hypothetical protein